jgi:hypothetical protein
VHLSARRSATLLLLTSFCPADPQNRQGKEGSTAGEQRQIREQNVSARRLRYPGAQEPQVERGMDVLLRTCAGQLRRLPPPRLAFPL